MGAATTALATSSGGDEVPDCLRDWRALASACFRFSSMTASTVGRSESENWGGAGPVRAVEEAFVSDYQTRRESMNGREGHGYLRVTSSANMGLVLYQ